SIYSGELHGGTGGAKRQLELAISAVGQIIVFCGLPGCVAALNLGSVLKGCQGTTQNCLKVVIINEKENLSAMNSVQEQQPRQTTRRRFYEAVIVGVQAIIGAALAIPAIA